MRRIAGEVGKGISTGRNDPQDAKRIESVSAKTGWEGQNGRLMTVRRNDKGFIKRRHCMVREGLLQWQQATDLLIMDPTCL